MNRKLKILNGSPGRARTADLVINSSSNTFFVGQKVEEFEALFCWPSCLVPRTETILNLPGHAAPKLARSKLEIRLGLKGCTFVATENLLNRRQSRGLRSGAGRRERGEHPCRERRRAGHSGPEAGVRAAEPGFTGLTCCDGSGPGFHRADRGRETEKLEI